MKINFTLNSLAYTKTIVHLVPRKNTAIAKVLFTKINEGLAKVWEARNKLIEEYCDPIEVEIEGKMEKRFKPREATMEEYLEKMHEASKVEVEFWPLESPALKNVVLDFPNIYIDWNTGERGLKGEDEIVAYEEVKALFSK